MYYFAADGFAYYDEENNLAGVTTEIFRDFIRWVENEYGYELITHYQSYAPPREVSFISGFLGISIHFESWSEFYKTVKESPSGTFGMGNVTITEERKKEIEFSPPYMTNIAVLITHKDTPELSAFDSIQDEFSHLRALAFEGTLHEDRINRFRDEYYPDLEIDYAYSNNEIIERVASANKYFAYIDVYNYWHAREAGLPIHRHMVGDEPSEQFGYILPKNSDWTPVITKFFEDNDGYLNSQRYREIMVEHLGAELFMLLEEARLNFQ